MEVVSIQPRRRIGGPAIQPGLVTYKGKDGACKPAARIINHFHVSRPYTSLTRKVVSHAPLCCAFAMSQRRTGEAVAIQPQGMHCRLDQHRHFIPSSLSASHLNERRTNTIDQTQSLRWRPITLSSAKSLVVREDKVGLEPFTANPVHKLSTALDVFAISAMVSLQRLICGPQGEK